MGGKVNKREDNLIYLLLKYEENSFLNRKTKEVMWKYNRKEAREKERHQLGLQISHDDFKVNHAYYHVFNSIMHTRKRQTQCGPASRK